MTKEVKLRRGTTTQHATFTGAIGEVTVDTDKKTLVVHDGITAGGYPVDAQLMRKLISRTVSAGENLVAFEWTQDDNGNDLALIDAEIRISIPANGIAVGTSGTVRLKLNGSAGGSDYLQTSALQGYAYANFFRTSYGRSVLMLKKIGLSYNMNLVSVLTDGTYYASNPYYGCTTFESTNIHTIYLYLSASGLTYFPVGTLVEIYGRTA